MWYWRTPTFEDTDVHRIRMGELVKAERLSASAYYKQIAGGKLGNCEPQYIRQADGSMVLKKIKLCNDAWGSGQCVAKWVNA